MKHIDNWESFNESILGDLSSKVGNALTSLKTNLFGGTESSKLLSKYNIRAKKIDNMHHEFIHNNRIIAELKTIDESKFELTIYMYESELLSNGKVSTSVQQNPIFKNQKEKPYNRGRENCVSVERAVEHLIKWWKKNAKSGKALNKDLHQKI
jgi:hypothetical protein